MGFEAPAPRSACGGFLFSITNIFPMQIRGGGKRRRTLKFLPTALHMLIQHCFIFLETEGNFKILGTRQKQPPKINNRGCFRPRSPTLSTLQVSSCCVAFSLSRSLSLWLALSLTLKVTTLVTLGQSVREVAPPSKQTAPIFGFLLGHRRKKPTLLAHCFLRESRNILLTSCSVPFRSARF